MVYSRFVVIQLPAAILLLKKKRIVGSSENPSRQSFAAITLDSVGSR